jgi:two-component system, NtrC family, response regulator PilR
VRGAFTGAAQTRKGLVEVAEKGTIFLDEIGEMTPTLQVKLLRVLQERTYRRVGDSDERPANIRVIAATNRDLEKDVAEQRFREDLFYRLNVIPVHLPPLRERSDDVPLIAAHFLSRFTREMGKPLAGFAPEALALLQAYRWPGNVRELENVVERSVALEQGDRVRVETLPAPIREGRLPGAPATAAVESFPGPGFRLEQHLMEIERTHLLRALKQAGGVQVRAAELLGLTFRQFRYLVTKHGLRDGTRQGE